VGSRDREQSTLVWRQAICAAAGCQQRVARDDVDALLEGMQVGIDVAGGFESAQGPAGVHGTDVAADERSHTEPARAIGPAGRKRGLDLGSSLDVGELARIGHAGLRE
jgi:hypothetical protein